MPRGPVDNGNEHEWTMEDYMQLAEHTDCFFCGDWTFNYLTRLDESKNFHPDNLVSECQNCRRIRGNRTLAEYKQLADDRGRLKPQ